MTVVVVIYSRRRDLISRPAGRCYYCVDHDGAYHCDPDVTNPSDLDLSSVYVDASRL